MLMNKGQLAVEEMSAKYQMVTENSGLRKGYKQTEVGVIPEDWDVRPISDVAPLQRGFDLPTTQLQKGLYPVVYSNGVLNFHNRAMVTAPGVVTGRSGTIGKVNYIECDYWPHNTTLWVTSFIGNVPKFIYYLYQGIKLERFSTGSGVPTLNRNDVHAFRIAVPPLPEQHAIAKAISDVDALLAKLDQLITKKRDLKQATMQQLLTGQTRLPGFSGEWEVKRLGKLFDVLAGGDFKAACSSVLQDEQHPFPIYSNSITDSGLYGFCSYGIYPKATITVTARGTVGAANYRDHSYTAIGRVLVLLPKQNLDGRFFQSLLIIGLASLLKVLGYLN